MYHDEELINDNESTNNINNNELTYELQALPGCNVSPTSLMDSPKYSPSMSPISVATSDTIEMRPGTDGILYTHEEFMEYYGWYGDDAWALADPRGPQQVYVSLMTWWDLTPLARRLSIDGQQVAELVRVSVGVRYPVYASPYASDDEASEPPIPMMLESPQSSAGE